MIRFYGIQPSELAVLSEEETAGLVANMAKISARERLEFIFDIMHALPSDVKGPRHYLVSLVNQAYHGDDRRRAIILEAITRKA